VAVEDAVPARIPRRGIITGFAVACYAAIASMTAVKTLPALIAVVLPAAAAVAWASRASPDAAEPTPGRRRASLLWAGVVMAALLWEAGALLGEHSVGSYQYPTVSALAEPVMADPVVRFVAWVGWLLAGWRLVRR
jgi:hypothetical protein